MSQDLQDPGFALTVGPYQFGAGRYPSALAHLQRRGGKHNGVTPVEEDREPGPVLPAVDFVADGAGMTILTPARSSGWCVAAIGGGALNCSAHQVQLRIGLGPAFMSRFASYSAA